MNYLTVNKIYTGLNRENIESGKERKDIELNISFSVTNKKSGRNKMFGKSLPAFSQDYKVGYFRLLFLSM